jgi:glycine/D-amino acid oxidase-like deaminating enzyme
VKPYDYIVVGLGIAGMSFCEQLHKHNKKFLVIDQPSNNSSLVAGGVCHPLVLKRFTLAWNAQLFLESSRPFYDRISARLGKNVVDDLSVMRIFANTEEQNDWTVASDKVALSNLVHTKVIDNHNSAVHAPFGYGKVAVSFKIRTQELLSDYSEWLQARNSIIPEDLNYDDLKVSDLVIQYKNIKAEKIVFCEGAQAKNNPFFPSKALIGKKGEYLVIKSAKLKLNDILKGSYFIIPIGKDLYKVGATFAHGDDSNVISEKGKEQLIAFIKKIITSPFEVVDHVAGVRPTVKDRRPLLGTHPVYTNLNFLNGLGTRGIMMAPLLSQWLYAYIENDKPLPSEVNINRFFT